MILMILYVLHGCFEMDIRLLNVCILRYNSSPGPIGAH